MASQEIIITCPIAEVKCTITFTWLSLVLLRIFLFTGTILLTSEVDYMGRFVNRHKQHLRQLKIICYLVLSEILIPISPFEEYALNVTIKMFTTWICSGKLWISFVIVNILDIIFKITFLIFCLSTHKIKVFQSICNS